jgi:hypothetical protein
MKRTPSAILRGLLTAALAAGGCGSRPGAASHGEPDVVASVINVTPFEVTAVISGVLGDVVDTVKLTVASVSSADQRFTCIDELVVGDPLAPDEAGVLIGTNGASVPIAPFKLLVGETFLCGDVVEIIVSGNDADTFAVDVFALTPPRE